MSNGEMLIKRLENQIDKMFETLAEIEEHEQAQPLRQLSDSSQTMLSMTFFNQVLMKNCWDNILKDRGLTGEQIIEYIGEVTELTKEHFKKLYGYDSIEKAKY